MALIRTRAAETRELDSLAAFSGLSVKGRSLLSQGTTVSECAAGAVILHKGQPVSGAYLVLRGRLRVFSITPNGTEATLYFIESGEACVLALNCLFSDILYPAWVQAESGTRVAIVPGVVFRRLFETERIIQNITVHALSTLVCRLMEELEHVHASDMRERLVHFILLRATADGALRMTQQQIARHLGTTREVIARLLGDFVRKKWLRTWRGGLNIVDLFALRAVIIKSPGTNLESQGKNSSR